MHFLGFNSLDRRMHPSSSTLFVNALTAIRIGHQIRAHDVLSRLSSISIPGSAYRQVLSYLKQGDDPTSLAKSLNDNGLWP